MPSTIASPVSSVRAHPEAPAARARTAPSVLPMRLLHWLLAAAFAGAWLTAESERWRDTHVLLGYTVFGLVAMRLLWHFVAGPRARIVSLIAGPVRTWRYVSALLTSAPGQHIGHNAIGAWAIVLVIALAFMTTVTGYMTFQNNGGEIVADLHEMLATTMLFAAIAHMAWIVGRTLLRRLAQSSGAAPQAQHAPRGHTPDSRPWPRRLAAAALVAGVAAFWALALHGDLPGLYGSEASATTIRQDSRSKHDD